MAWRGADVGVDVDVDVDVDVVDPDLSWLD